MKSTQTMDMQDDSASYGLQLVSEHPVYNASCFTIMRAVRFVLALVCEVIAIMAAVAVGMSGFATLGWFLGAVMFVFGGVMTTIEGWGGIGQGGDWSNFYIAELSTRPYRNELVKFLVLNPYVILIPSLFAVTIAFGQSLAIGLPYRWKNMPPGMMTVRCGACKGETANTVTCGKCKASRAMEYMTLKLLWLANVFITTAWVMHDCVAGFVGFSRGR